MTEEVTRTLTPSESALLEATRDPVAYIENLLWSRDMDDRIVRQLRQRARVRRSMEEALDCTDPKVTIGPVRGWMSDLS